MLTNKEKLTLKQKIQEKRETIQYLKTLFYPTLEISLERQIKVNDKRHGKTYFI